MKLKINKQNYLLYLVIFTIILLLFFYLLSDKEAIIRQLYKEFNGTSLPSGVLREGISADGLDWIKYEGDNSYQPLAEGVKLKVLTSGSAAYNFSSIETSTNNIVRPGDQYFTIIFTGFFTPNKTGVWYFMTESDDSSFIWIDTPQKPVKNYNESTALVANTGAHGMLSKNAKYGLMLNQGDFYPIRIQMSQGGGPCGLRIAWKDPTGNWSSDGSGLFLSNSPANKTSSQSGLIWTAYKRNKKIDPGYFGNDTVINQQTIKFPFFNIQRIMFPFPSAIRQDNVRFVLEPDKYKLIGTGRAVNTSSLYSITNGKIKESTCIQDNGRDSYPTGYLNCGSGSDDHEFSLDMTGSFYTNTEYKDPQIWKFFITSDDASYLWIKEKAFDNWSIKNADIDNGNLHGMNIKDVELKLESNTYYSIRIIFGENTGGYNFRFGWKPPGGNWTCDGSLYLYSENYSNIVGDYAGALAGK